MCIAPERGGDQGSAVSQHTLGSAVTNSCSAPDLCRGLFCPQGAAKPPFELHFHLKPHNFPASQEPGCFPGKAPLPISPHPRGSFTPLQFVNILLRGGRQDPGELFQGELCRSQSRARRTWGVLLLLLPHPRMAMALFGSRFSLQNPPRCFTSGVQGVH